MKRLFWTVFACVALSVPTPLQAERNLVSLDGTWQIADGHSGAEMPEVFDHRVAVPGLANLAQPPFEKVDEFFSREHLANRIRAKLCPAAWLTNYWKGKSFQDRNYFWYRRSFKAPTRRAVALLKINKAQFGTAVWLNGQKLGEYAGCFSASYFHLQEAIRWQEQNTLVIRVGAHPAVLPDTYPTGSDFEKIKWTPGIYDSVSVIFCDNPLIRSVQVAPRLDRSEILVQTVVENRGPDATFDLSHRVKTWKRQKTVGQPCSETVTLKAGETKTLLQTLAIPQAHLWSPEDPFLYTLESGTGGDCLTTRFGMREFRFDGATGRAYLNGKVYFLRGSNITLHRFFEDPLCGGLPWKERWVRKLLGDLPKKMHWNYFRFCIGPVPDRWLEICDEEGLLIQNEFFVWTGRPSWYPGYARTYDTEEMIRQYRDWMRDNWNHPSVAVWDANNESENKSFEETIIPAVRPLDLSNRPWENSYNTPAGAIDPVEDHPYLMYSGFVGDLKFKMTDLETMDGKPRAGSLPSDQHAPIINEYGWLWLNRDGTPTRLTENVYAQLLGRQATARQRLDLYAYLLGGKTEFWRAHRHYAGIIHFVYLTCSYPGVYTADHFRDVTRLQLDPAFADYLGEAFKPLGVYINFFQPTLEAGTSRTFTVMLVNDTDAPANGTLVLSLETRSGRPVVRAEQRFAMKPLGDTHCEIALAIPAETKGPCLLKATARPDRSSKMDRTLSRRWVTVEPPSQ